MVAPTRAHVTSVSRGHDAHTSTNAPTRIPTLARARVPVHKTAREHKHHHTRKKGGRDAEPNPRSHFRRRKGNPPRRGDLGCAICGRDRPEQVILKVEIATDGGDINDNYAHVSCILLDLKELMDSLDEDFLLSNLEG